MGEWSDISSAPEDGTVFLAWGRWEKHPATVKWDSEAKDFVYVCDGERVIQSTGDYFRIVYKDDGGFTHWQPLPAPPLSKFPGKE